MRQITFTALLILATSLVGKTQNTNEATLNQSAAVVFTPNGDGVNDLLFIHNLEEVLDISIYNRWGELIYYSDNYKNNFDGTSFAGINVPEGIYYYVAKSNESGTTLTSYFHILR